MRRKYSVLLAGLALASCQSTPSTQLPPKVTTPYILTREDAVAIQSGLASVVRDPASLILGAAKAATNDKGTVEVCGNVNGKNGFGGYTGDMIYLGMLTTNQSGQRGFAVVGVGDGSYKSQALSLMCQQSNIL